MAHKKALVLVVQPNVSHPIPQIVSDAVELAAELRLTVALTLNNVEFAISPNANVEALLKEYNKLYKEALNGETAYVWG
jgi:hypothetical protein